MPPSQPPLIHPSSSSSGVLECARVAKASLLRIILIGAVLVVVGDLPLLLLSLLDDRPRNRVGGAIPEKDQNPAKTKNTPRSFLSKMSCVMLHVMGKF